MSGSMARACCLRTAAPSGPFSPAARRRWAANSTAVTVAGNTSRIIPAIIGLVPSAATPTPPNGWTGSAGPAARALLSGDLHRARAVAFAHPVPPETSFTRSCCARAPGRWPTWRAPTRTWARSWACWRCCRPGRAICGIIRTSIASCPAGDGRRGLRWVRPKRPDYFLPQRVLAARFRNRLKQVLNSQPAFRAKVPALVWRQAWVADVQPVGRGEPALKYLAAYVYRTALSAERIVADDGQHITFAWRDNQEATHHPVAGRSVPAPLFAARPAQGLAARALLRLAQSGRHQTLGTHFGVAGLEGTGAQTPGALPAAPVPGLSPADDFRGPASTRPARITPTIHPQDQSTRPIKKSSGVNAAVLSPRVPAFQNGQWHGRKTARAHHRQAGKCADQVPGIAPWNPKPALT